MAAATTAWSVFKTFSTDQQAQQSLHVSLASDPMICMPEYYFQQTKENNCLGPLCRLLRHLGEEVEGGVILFVFFTNPCVRN